MNKLFTVASILVLVLPTRRSGAEAEQPAPVEAKGEERFGNARTFVIGGDFVFAIHRQANDDYSFTDAGVHPSVDYFMLDHLSMGMAVTIDHSRWSSYGMEGSRTTMGVAPRIGYEIPIGSVFSLWPTVGIFHWRVLAEDSSYASPGRWSLSGYARAPLLAHVAKHFFLGGGPEVGVRLADSTGSSSAYGFGFASTLGGWF